MKSVKVHNLFAVVVVAMFAMTAFAALQKDQIFYQSKTGDWDDTTLWKDSSSSTYRLPKDGDYVRIEPGASKGELTLTLTHDLTNNYYQIQLRPNTDTFFTLDGNGYAIVPREPTEEFLGTEVFHVAGAGTYSHCFSLEQPGYTNYFQSRPYQFDNPLISVYMTNGLGAAEFRRGTYNMAGVGTTIDAARTLVLFGNATASSLTWFSGGTYLLPTVNIKGTGVTNLFYITGPNTKATSYGMFYAYLGTPATTRELGLVVNDGATLELKSGFEWRQSDLSLYTNFYPHRTVAFRNGAKLIQGNGGIIVKSANTDFEFSGGAIFDANGSASANYIGTDATSTNFSFTLDSATWKGGSGVTTIGTYSCPTPLRLLMTNATVASASDWYFDNTTGSIVDSAFTQAVVSTKNILLRSGSDLMLDGGTVKGRHALKVGDGGTVASPDSGCKLTITDGDHEFYNIYVGNANYAAVGATSVLHQVGGKIKLNGGGSAGWAYCDVSSSKVENGCPGILILDGGEMECTQVKGSDGAACRGGPGWAELSANGGKIVVWSPTSPYLAYFDKAALGPKGLTLDTAGYNATVTQNFTDKAGAKGLFVKTGTGTMTLDVTAYSVATTRVDNGTLKLNAASADAFSTYLEVTGSGTFSLEGDSSAITLSGFKATDGGLLVLNTNDVITVDGPAELGLFEVNLVETPELGDTVNWLVVNGELSEASKAALRRVVCANNLADGTHAKFDFIYDELTTTVRLSVVEDASPIGEANTTLWQGTTSDWGTDGNWSANAPTAEKKAAFTSVSAVKTVNVPGAAVAGALTFGTDGYTLAGEQLEIAAVQGAAQIETTSAGTTVISAPMYFNSLVYAPLASASTVTVSGVISGFGVKKTGLGELQLNNANVFAKNAIAAGGRLTATMNGAFGANAPGMVTGTLALDGAIDTIPGLAVKAATSNESVILDVKRDVSIGSFATESGAIVKRGSGTLTLDMTGGNTYTLGCMASGAGTGVGNGVGAYVDNVIFPADGSSIGHGYGGFTVAEGEVVIKNNPSSSARTYASGSVIIGMPLAAYAKQPILTVDGAYLNANLKMPPAIHFFLGAWAGYAGNAVTSPVLCLKNGAVLYADTFRSGYGSGTAAARPYIAMTNATLRGGYATYFAETTSDALSVYRLKDAKLYTGAASIDSAQFKGTIDMDAENTELKNNNGGICRVSVSSASYGRIFFHDGGLFHVSAINAGSKPTRDITFAFDDTEWRGADSGSYALLSQENYNGHVLFENVGKGVIFAPDASATVTLGLPFGGAGGMQIKSGTVAFESGTYGFTGPCAISTNATADLGSAGTIAEAAFAGSGTVKNGTFGKATIIIDASDDWTPRSTLNFDGCAFSGDVTIDFGRTKDNPLSATLPKNMVIATFTGTAPDVSRWHLDADATGLDKKTYGIFVVDATHGKIKMTVTPPTGGMILLR